MCIQAMAIAANTDSNQLHCRMDHISAKANAFRRWRVAGAPNSAGQAERLPRSTAQDIAAGVFW